MMLDERVRNAIRNTKWGIMQRITSIVLPFIVRSILIYELSAEYAGLSGLFTSILFALNLSELGFSNLIIYNMYKPIADGDKKKVCALLNLYRKVYRIIGIVITVLGLLLIPFLKKLINGNVPNDFNIYFLYFIYLSNSLISYYLYGYKTSLLSANQREDIVSKNTLIYNIIMYFSQCVVIILFKNYYYYVIMIPISTIILNYMNKYAVDKLFPDYYPEGNIEKDEVIKLKKDLFGLIIWKIGGASRNSFDNIFISYFMGLVTVTIYDNYFCIISGVDTLLAVICTSITAGIGNKIATKSIQENYNDFHKFHFLYMWIAGWCIVCIFCLMQPFMNIWMGDKLMFPNVMVWFFCYYFFMMKKGDINSVYYHAAGLWWEGKYRSIFESLLNIMLNYFLGKLYGVIGIILATIISFSIVNIYGASIIFSKYFKNKKYLKYCFENFLFLIVIVIACILTKTVSVIICDWFSASLLLGNMLIIFMVCLILPNLLFLSIFWIFPQYRNYILYIKNILLGRLGNVN